MELKILIPKKNLTECEMEEYLEKAYISVKAQQESKRKLKVEGLEEVSNILKEDFDTVIDSMLTEITKVLDPGGSNEKR